MQMLQFFMVLADNSNVTNVRHKSLEGAQREARRLADTNPGVRFFVLASVGHALRADPVVWEQHDDVPF